MTTHVTTTILSCSFINRGSFGFSNVTQPTYWKNYRAGCTSYGTSIQFCCVASVHGRGSILVSCYRAKGLLTTSEIFNVEKYWLSIVSCSRTNWSCWRESWLASLLPFWTLLVYFVQIQTDRFKPAPNQSSGHSDHLRLLHAGVFSTILHHSTSPSCSRNYAPQVGVYQQSLKLKFLASYQPTNH